MEAVGIAASIISIATAGIQVSIKLITLSTQISSASERLSSISNDVSLTSGVLHQLGELMRQKTTGGGISIFSEGGLETTRTSAAMCERIFKEVENEAAKASEQLRGCRKFAGGKIKLSKSEKLKWPFLQPSIDILRADLREAKGTLMLMLQVTTLALSKKMADLNASASSEQVDIIRAIVSLQQQHDELRLQDSVSTKKRVTNGKPFQASPSIGSLSTKVYQDSDSRVSGSTARVLTPTCSGVPTHKAACPPPLTFPIMNTMARVKMAATQSKNIGSNNDSKDGEGEHINATQRGLPTEVPCPGSNSSSVTLQSSESSSSFSHLNKPLSAMDHRCHGPPSSIGPIHTDDRGPELQMFMLKPIVKDFFDKVELSWSIQNPKMHVSAIKNHVARMEEDGHPSVIDMLGTLYAHEHAMIDTQLAGPGSQGEGSLLSLKRTKTDIQHRDIMFKGVPGLQFVVEPRAVKPIKRKNVDYVAFTSPTATSRGPNRPPAFSHSRNPAEYDHASYAARSALSSVYSIDEDYQSKEAYGKPKRRSWRRSNTDISIDTNIRRAENPEAIQSPSTDPDSSLKRKKRVGQIKIELDKRQSLEKMRARGAAPKFSPGVRPKGNDIAQASSARAAVAGLVERFRSTSRRSGTGRSRSRSRPAQTVATAGLSTAAVAVLLRKKRENEKFHYVVDESSNYRQKLPRRSADLPKSTTRSRLRSASASGEQTTTACRRCKRRELKCSGSDSLIGRRCTNCVGLARDCISSPAISQRQEQMPAIRKLGPMVPVTKTSNSCAQLRDELEVSKGQALILVAQSHPDWVFAERLGQLGAPGFVPVSRIEFRDLLTNEVVLDVRECLKEAALPTLIDWKKKEDVNGKYVSRIRDAATFHDKSSTSSSSDSKSGPQDQRIHILARKFISKGGGSSSTAEETKIGHGIDSESDISTNPSIIVGPIAGQQIEDRNHWPCQDVPTQPKANPPIQGPSSRHEHEEQMSDSQYVAESPLNLFAKHLADSGSDLDLMECSAYSRDSLENNSIYTRESTGGRYDGDIIIDRHNERSMPLKFDRGSELIVEPPFSQVEVITHHRHVNHGFDTLELPLRESNRMDGGDEEEYSDDEDVEEDDHREEGGAGTEDEEAIVERLLGKYTTLFD